MKDPGKPRHWMSFALAGFMVAGIGWLADHVRLVRDLDAQRRSAKSYQDVCASLEQAAQRNTDALQWSSPQEQEVFQLTRSAGGRATVSITGLDIRSAEDQSSLVGRLQNLTNVKALSFHASDNDIDAVLHLPLTELYLERSSLTGSGLTKIASLTSLKTLCLDNTRIVDEDLESLKDMTTLEWLDLQGTGVTGPGLKHLSRLVNLRFLDLHDTAITDPALEHVRPLVGLRHLVLIGTKVTDAGLEHLRGLPIEDLDLEGTSVTGPGLVVLQELPALRRLYLSRLQLDDAAETHLAALKNLERLFLYSTEIDGEAVDRLEESLPNCEIYYSP